VNKREIDKLIPISIDEIDKLKSDAESEESFFEVEEVNHKKIYKINREFNGYISSFGSSIVQSGLISTVAFFCIRNSNSNRDRKKISELILKIILKNKKEQEGKYESLLKYVLEADKDGKLNLVKEEIINAATALKLSMRVFEFTGNDESKVSS